MEIFETLSSYGLTPKVLQVIIIVGAFLAIVGVFWKLIVTGAILAFVVMVFSLPTGAKTTQDKLEESFKKEFMEDCVHYGDTKQTCETIWNERNTQ